MPAARSSRARIQSVQVRECIDPCSDDAHGVDPGEPLDVYGVATEAPAVHGDEDPILTFDPPSTWKSQPPDQPRPLLESLHSKRIHSEPCSGLVILPEQVEIGAVLLEVGDELGVRWVRPLPVRSAAGSNNAAGGEEHAAQHGVSGSRSHRNELIPSVHSCASSIPLKRARAIRSPR